MKLCGKLFLTILLWPAIRSAVQAQQPALTYVWGKAYHILPETHTDESGYFSLCVGLDGKVYVGTAAYGRNSYLVQFDPATEQQRIVIDTHRLCGLSATGYAAQAKIHTRNYVGPSGTIYVGSKQGYRRGRDDTADYPGGYAMTYDPRTGSARNLGMPYPGQGVIDVVADEGRGLLYVVTCEDQHWMVGDLRTDRYRELGPMLTPYATTLMDRRGRAHAITKDFQMATYDPRSNGVTIRPVFVGRERWQRKDNGNIPYWVPAKDGRTAYLVLMNDPTLLRFDLLERGNTLHATNLGKMIEGKNPDSRNGLALAPDGRVYAVFRVDNTTGFGTGYLHHLLRYDPKTRKHEDLGVLAVRNPDFFDWRPGPEGKPKPWTHGYHRLPDGTLTPLHCHMGLAIASDNTIYVTVLYPFTLLRIDAFRAGGVAR